MRTRPLARASRRRLGLGAGVHHAAGAVFVEVGQLGHRRALLEMRTVRRSHNSMLRCKYICSRRRRLFDNSAELQGAPLIRKKTLFPSPRAGDEPCPPGRSPACRWTAGSRQGRQPRLAIRASPRRGRAAATVGGLPRVRLDRLRLRQHGRGVNPAEPLPGPTTTAAGGRLPRLDVWAVVGMLEDADRGASSTPASWSAPTVSSPAIARSICRFWAWIASRRRAIGRSRSTTSAVCASA